MSAHGMKAGKSPGPSKAELVRLTMEAYAAICAKEIRRDELVEDWRKVPENVALGPDGENEPRAAGHRVGCPCKFCEAIKRNTARAKARGAKAKDLGVLYNPKEARSKIRRRLFFEFLSDPNSPTVGNPLQSAKRTGIKSNSYAAREAQKWLDSDARKRILEADAQAGITDQYLAAKRRELLEAQKIELAQKDGEFTDWFAVPDNPTRVRALELTHRVRGEMPKEEADGGVSLILRIGNAPIQASEWDSFVEVEDKRAVVLAAERSQKTIVASAVESEAVESK